MAGRTKQAYGFKHSLKFAPTDPADTNVKGFYWVITNLNQDFYGYYNLRNVLGIYPVSF